MEPGESHSGAGRPPKQWKRAIFKSPPAWAKTGSPVTIGEDAFSLSNQSYVREQQEKAQLEREKLAQKNKDEEKQHKQVTDGHGSRKRRRISGNGSGSGESDDEVSTMKSPTRRHKSDLRSTTLPTSVSDPMPQIKAEIFKSSPLKSRREPIIINVCSSDGEEEDATPYPGPQPKSNLERTTIPPLLPRPIETAAQLSPPNTIENDQQSNSDAEFERFAKEARERISRDKARQDGAALSLAAPLLQSNSYNTATTNTTQSTAPKPLPEAKIALLVHSRIPDTKPLIVHITLTTKLKVIREAWLLRQDLLPDKVKDEIYFTWRKKRLFDFTTCKSLGMSVDENGELVIASTTPMTWENGQVEIEAVTREIVEKDQEMTTSAKESPEPRLDAHRPAKQDEATIRIVLKARGSTTSSLKSDLLQRLIRS